MPKVYSVYSLIQHTLVKSTHVWNSTIGTKKIESQNASIDFSVQHVIRQSLFSLSLNLEMLGRVALALLPFEMVEKNWIYSHTSQDKIWKSGLLFFKANRNISDSKLKLT